MDINRELESKLNTWRQSPLRKPLLIRGARQVGKSFLIEAFGKKYFKNIITVNFELNTEYKKCFHTLDPKQICESIKIICQQPLLPGQSLLFLDEIQDCPSAIQALRYFKELLPELHVIGAGSLLELVLRHADFRIPVGRVSFLYLFPLSFKEFITVINPLALEQIENCSIENPIAPVIHDYLLKQIRAYFFIGGMPEAVASYIQTEDLQVVQEIQTHVLTTYRNDFGHYSEWANPKHLQMCFDQIPQLIGQQVKYNKIDPDIRSRELKEAIQVLEDISILQRIQATAATGLPLSTVTNPKKFKLNFIDIGLVKRMEQLDAALLLERDNVLLNSGGLAEQFVGQELLAYHESFEKALLYFWARDGVGQAEVDYIITHGTHIIPVEVKAGKIGRLRSLKQFLLEKPATIGIRISEQPLSLQTQVLSVPFYLMSEIPRLLAVYFINY